MKNLQLTLDFHNPKPIVKTLFVFDKAFFGFPQMQIEYPFSSMSKKYFANIKRPLDHLLESQKTEKQTIKIAKT